jgi:hypothetical protein
MLDTLSVAQALFEVNRMIMIIIIGTSIDWYIEAKLLHYKTNLIFYSDEKRGLQEILFLGTLIVVGKQS